MKTYLSIFIILFFASSLDAQQQEDGFINKLPDFPNISTPMAASFQKYIDNPINLYNGTPDISIPLFELKDGELDIPVMLRYNSSGIRANEEASWVGLGWNLNVGGVITQSVVGESDYNDTEYGYLLNNLGLFDKKIYNGYSTVNYTSALHTALQNYLNSPNQNYHSGKLNPDVYYFSYPGGSGKFIIDYRDNSIHQLAREENLKIQISETDNSYAIKNRSFQITTTEGIVHTFNYISSLYSNDLVHRPVSVSYALTSSLYPNGQRVLYSYTTTPVKYPRKNYFFQVPFASQGQNIGDHYSNNTETVMNGTEFYLDKVCTTRYQMTFNLADRNDIYGGKQLTSIQVTPLNIASSVLKDIRFAYTYFVSSTGYSYSLPIDNWRDEYNTHRLRLDSVYQQQGKRKDACHTFYYNNVVSPKFTYNMDYWGYYNGVDGIRRNTYLPDISRITWGRFLNMQFGSDFYSKFQKYATYTNRSYSFTDCQAGILRQINYPTGGYVKYEYEPNSFMDKKVPDETSETIVNEDWNMPKSPPTNFNVPADSQADVEVRLSRGLNSWQDVWEAGGGSFTLLHISSGTPGAICSHSFKEECLYYANHYPDATEIIYKTSINLPIQDNEGYTYTYILSADFPNSLGLQYGASTKHGSTRAQVKYKLSNALVDAEIQGCGLRVKSVRHYESTSSRLPLIETEYEYQDPHTDKCSGVLHEQLQFIKPYYGVYNLLQGSNPPGQMPDRYLIQQNVAEVTGDNAIANPYSTIGSVGYSYVKKTRKSIGSLAGYTVYQFKNEVPDYTLGSIRLNHPLNGKLLSVKEYNNSNRLLKSDTYTYRSDNSHFYFGVNILDYMNMFTGIYGNGSSLHTIPYDENEGYLPGRLRIILHQLNSYDVTLINKLSMQDGISTTEKYTYDPITLQRLSRIIRLSDNDSLTYVYSYPNHFNFTPYVEMTQQNRIKPVIESRLLKKGNLQGGVLVQYDSKSGKIFPKCQYESSKSGVTGSPSTWSAAGVSASFYPCANVVWNKRDKYGNCLEMNTADVNTVYLWAYNNQYPVAKIEGATYAEIQNWLSITTISSLASNSTTVSGALSTIRNLLSGKKVLVTTYTYSPLVGITSMVTPNGTVTNYEYDSFGRLFRVKDGNNKVIKEYDYKYRP